MNIGFSIGKTSGKSTTDSKQTTTKGTDQSNKLLANLSDYLNAALVGGNAGLSKDAAIADASGVVNKIFKDYSSTVLPQILTLQGNAGVYSDTATQNLANDAFAKANTDAATAVLDNIKAYQQLLQNDKQLNLNGLLSALGLVQDSNQTSTGSGTTKTSGLQLGLTGAGKS